MSAAQLQEEAALRARLATADAEVVRLRRALERAGISPDAAIQQISEMMPKREHHAITDELRRQIRKLNDDLTRERARNSEKADLQLQPLEPAGDADGLDHHDAHLMS
ncbi:hypothetical protein [Achromobacter sp. DH1f]|uniref:hypothetical protein n=1 Tax=Achromobacter sp. DH1f TaxID=1397275 RepID=UPI00046AF838|nr:hypothetical protein [Achromobacter sp. DH1f]